MKLLGDKIRDKIAFKNDKQIRNQAEYQIQHGVWIHLIWKNFHQLQNHILQDLSNKLK